MSQTPWPEAIESDSRRIEMHHGSIRAFSDGLGKGAKFVIDLETAA
jgi:hypothetical protein